MSLREQWKLSFAAVLIAAAASLWAGCSASGGPDRASRPAPPASEDSASVTLDGTDWTLVRAWDFAHGLFPGGWGWGTWEIRNKTLQGESRDDDFSVYFFPVVHGDDALLETKVRFESSVPGHRVEAQLLTRDQESICHESGLVLFADRDSVDVRHMAHAHDYVREGVPLTTRVTYGEWHVMRFLMRGGEIHAYIDDEHVYSSVASAGRDEADPELRALGGVFPVGIYDEPHLAVKWGTASFEYVKLYLAGAEGTAVASNTGARREHARSLSTFRVDRRHWAITLMLYLFYAVIFIVCIYLVRHYVFTVNRLFGRQRQPYIDIDTADWPQVTIVIPAHDEEVVISEILEALLDVDYPLDRMTIMPVNDRSKDRTGEIIDEIAARHPNTIEPYHRTRGSGGKAAALKDATARVRTEIMLVFDADYIPGRGLIKQLVAPFFDPEVGAVMGRVVPYNVDSNLLTRLLDLERAGGYQVDQQARMNMKLVPQYGGTVGGVRRTALESVGGWQTDSLAEDTDATYRLLLSGWKTVYQNRSECYEQVPETWASRLRQITRWAKGHNQVTNRYTWALIRNRRTSLVEKIDGLLLLGVYVMSPVLLFGWTLGIILWYLGEPRSGLIILLAVTAYSTLGNFAVFFEITAATYLDGTRLRIRLLPFVFLGFLVSLLSITRATFVEVTMNGNGKNGAKRKVVWDKTERSNSFNGHTNGQNGYHFHTARNEE